jgi:hypothetical protein
LKPTCLQPISKTFPKAQKQEEIDEKTDKIKLDDTGINFYYRTLAMLSCEQHTLTTARSLQ